MTNHGCVVETPAKLAAWWKLAEMCRGIHLYRRDWRIVKSDHWDSYKQLRIDPDRSSLAAISWRSPADGRRYDFTRRTVMFGAASAGINYYSPSRILDELMSRIFGIPTNSYFGDFGAFIPYELAHTTLFAISECCELLGARLQLKGSASCDRIAFVGLL